MEVVGVKDEKLIGQSNLLDDIVVTPMKNNDETKSQPSRL